MEMGPKNRFSVFGRKDLFDGKPVHHPAEGKEGNGEDDFGEMHCIQLRG